MDERDRKRVVVKERYEEEKEGGERDMRRTEGAEDVIGMCLSGIICGCT